MLSLVLRRMIWMIPTLFAVSVITFFLIQLPPGSYLESQIAALEELGEPVSMEQVAALRKQYDLDRPLYVQYASWIWKILRHGDMGMSFEHNRPVRELIGEQILLTAVVSLASILFVWGVAIPIGIYSAVKQYSVLDYVFTFVGFVGLATPNFTIALLFMYVGQRFFGVSAGGLFSPGVNDLAWFNGWIPNWTKFGDLLIHLWVPVIVIGTAGTASMIRVMRGNLLDELGKQYVTTARAKGVHPIKLLFKYPVRVAINPMISTIGWLLPTLVSGSVIVAVVLGLPTTGPMLLRALQNQDMYLAGSMVLMLSTLTVIGTLISDLLLMWVDPRIRYEEKGR